jgi:hypothetical protein
VSYSWPITRSLVLQMLSITSLLRLQHLLAVM